MEPGVGGVEMDKGEWKRMGIGMNGWIMLGVNGVQSVERDRSEEEWTNE